VIYIYLLFCTCIYIYLLYAYIEIVSQHKRFAIKWQGSHPSGIFMCLHCARYFTADMSSACAKAPRAEREVTTQKLHHDSGQKHPNQSKSYVLVHPAATRENINSNISRPLATGLRWVSSVCETAPNRSGTHPWQEGWEALAVEPRLPRNAKPFQTGTVLYWIIRRGPSNDIQTYSNWF